MHAAAPEKQALGPCPSATLTWRRGRRRNLMPEKQDRVGFVRCPRTLLTCLLLQPARSVRHLGDSRPMPTMQARAQACARARSFASLCSAVRAGPSGKAPIAVSAVGSRCQSAASFRFVGVPIAWEAKVCDRPSTAGCGALACKLVHRREDCQIRAEPSDGLRACTFTEVHQAYRQ